MFRLFLWIGLAMAPVIIVGLIGGRTAGLIAFGVVIGAVTGWGLNSLRRQREHERAADATESR